MSCGFPRAIHMQSILKAKHHRKTFSPAPWEAAPPGLRDSQRTYSKGARDNAQPRDSAWVLLILANPSDAPQSLWVGSESAELPSSEQPVLPPGDFPFFYAQPLKELNELWWIGSDDTKIASANSNLVKATSPEAWGRARLLHRFALGFVKMMQLCALKRNLHREEMKF